MARGNSGTQYRRNTGCSELATFVYTQGNQLVFFFLVMVFADKKKMGFLLTKKLAPRTRLELATYRLTADCSNQLSYPGAGNQLVFFFRLQSVCCSL